MNSIGPEDGAYAPPRTAAPARPGGGPLAPCARRGISASPRRLPGRQRNGAGERDVYFPALVRPLALRFFLGLALLQPVTPIGVFWWITAPF